MRTRGGGGGCTQRVQHSSRELVYWLDGLEP
jgi:hypothetical protein